MKTHRGHPPVSVVIATHNRPQLLAAALTAVLTQDYPGRIECIVVFDRCEPDQSLARESDNRIVRVISNTRTPGLAGARNSGIKAATGTLVAFCDDDDEWVGHKLSMQVPAIERSADILTCVSGITVCYADHETVRIPAKADLTLERLARRRTMEAHPSTVLVRAAALRDRIGLVDENIPGSYGEDFDWLLRAVQAGSIVVVPQSLVRVRWGNSLFSQKWDTIIAAIDYGLNKHEVLRRDRRGLARLYGRRSFALAALGRRGESVRWSWRTIRLSPRELRAYLALLVSLRLVRADQLMRLAHSSGRGI